MTRRAVVSDDGLTLIELLITITILGLAITAMLGGMITLLSTSGLHRNQADVSSVVESAAEAVKADTYTSCAASYSVPSSGQSDASVTSVTVSYWNTTGTGFTTPCPTPDQGLQLVTITATSNNGSVSQSLSVVKAART